MIRSTSRQAKWRRANPLRYLAHRYIENAIRLGVIKRQPCEVCGQAKADAHHDDYSRPLIVRWLCRRHHAQLHAKQRRAA